MKKQLVFLIAALSVAATGFAQEALKVVCGPYLQNVSPSGMTVMWETNNDAMSWVEVAPDDGSHFYAAERPRHYDTNLGKKKIGTLHAVTVSGLEPGVKYRYRIYSQEVLERKRNYVSYGKIVATDVYRGKPFTVTVPDPAKKTVSFVMVNDIHQNNELLSSLVGQEAAKKADFVVVNGDMVNNMDSNTQVFDSWLGTASKLFAAEKPFYYARGNHETRGEFSERFMDYFPTPTGMPYYTFRYGSVLFIVLDGGEDKPDTDMEYYGTAAYDDYRIREAEWLKSVVVGDEFKNSTHRIVITHIPPLRSTWHGPLEAKRLFVPILNEAGVDLMLCGHLHSHSFSEAGTEGCDFPILINSNKHIAGVETLDGMIRITVFDETGKVLKQIDLN